MICLSCSSSVDLSLSTHHTRTVFQHLHLSGLIGSMWMLFPFMTIVRNAADGGFDSNHPEFLHFPSLAFSVLLSSQFPKHVCFLYLNFRNPFLFSIYILASLRFKQWSRALLISFQLAHAVSVCSALTGAYGANIFGFALSFVTAFTGALPFSYPESSTFQSPRGRGAAAQYLRYR